MNDATILTITHFGFSKLYYLNTVTCEKTYFVRDSLTPISSVYLL